MTASGLLAALMFALGLTGTLWAILAVRLIPERLWPAQPKRPPGDRVNLFVWLAYTAAQFALSPAVGGVVTLAVNRAGGGLIVLPSHGLGLALGAAVYLIAMDFGEYAFHRAQHAIPALWAMHTLHHSDPHFDSTTAARHFWLEPVIKSVTIWLAVGVLFKASPAMVAIYAAATYYNVVIHSNTRLHLGWASWLVNSPAYHRLHHSASPEHWNCNFAALLPVFDLIFGGYRRPGPTERPRTGLDTGEAPASLAQAAAWPLRRLWRSGAAGAEPAA